MTPPPVPQQATSVEIPDLLLDLVDHIDAMVAYWDADQVCRFANNAYRAWFGKTREQIVGHTLQELLGPLYPLNLPYVRGAYAGSKQVFERAIRTPDGDTRYSLATYHPDVVDGRVRGIFVHVADVTPMKKLEMQLQGAIAKAEYLATHDVLTGLPNRALLGDRFEQALAQSRRSGEMLAVVAVDLDDFKGINDRHGHADGDRLLVEVSARMKAALRESDTLARLGGDEFLLLATGIDSPSHAATIARHVLAAINQPFRVGGVEIRPAASVGIAIHPLHGTTADTLMLNADRAMYAAKARGKNGWALAPDPPPDSARPAPE